MEISSGILVVAGPTASGKSDLAMRLAEEFDGELICSDSMQVYRKFDIGTSKPTLSEQKLIPHHQLDLIDPDGNYSANSAAWAPANFGRWFGFVLPCVDVRNQ